MLKFKPKLWPTLICVFTLSLLINLGFWQLHRYHYKQDLLQQFQHAVHGKPLTLAQTKTLADLRFQHLRIRGHYLNSKTMLLQNRFNQSRVGFEVLTPLKIECTDSRRAQNRSAD